jgi:HAMP domain-containing protein
MEFGIRSIGWKLMAAIGGCFATLVGAALVVSWIAWSDVDLFKREVEVRDSVTPLVLMVDADFRGQVQQWKNLLLRGSDPVAHAVHLANFEALEARTESEALMLREALSDPRARQGVDEFIRAHRDAGQRYRAGLRVYDRSGYDARAADALVIGVDRAPMALLKDVAASIRHASQLSFEAMFERVENRVFATLVAVLACALAAGLAALWIVWTRVVSPTRRVLAELDRLVAGDFDSEPGLSSEDELGQISARVDRIRRTLARLLDRPSALPETAALFCAADVAEAGPDARVDPRHGRVRGI